MRILFVNAHIGKGGGQVIQTNLLIKELKKKNKVKLVTLKHKANVVDEPCDIEYAGRFRFPLGLYDLYKKIKSIEKYYDLIVALDPYFSFPIVSFSKKPKAVRFGIDPIEELKIRNKKFSSKIYKIFYSRLLKNYSTVIFNNKRLREKYGVWNHQSYFIPNGCEIPYFKKMDKAKLRDVLKLKKEDIMLLYTGKVIPRKNLEPLFKVLYDTKNIFLVIVGNINEEHYGYSYYNYLAKKYRGVMGKVIFTGEVHQEKIPLFLKAADIFVFPSLLEGSPNSVLEAMAYKLPAICLDTFQHREIIKHGKTGFLFKNDGELLHYVNLLKKDKDLRKAIGNEAREYIVKNHDIKRIRNGYMKIFEEIVSKGRREC